MAVGNGDCDIEASVKASSHGPKNNKIISLAYHHIDNLMAAGDKSRAIQVLSGLLQETECDELESRIINVMFILAVDDRVWKYHRTIPAKLRDIIKAAFSETPPSDLLRERVACIAPGQKLNVAEKTRFLQLQSLLLGSNTFIETWVYQTLESSSPDQDYLVYQLLSGKEKAIVSGEKVTDKFMTFMQEHQKLGEYCFNRCVKKLEQVARDSNLGAMKSAKSGRHYMLGITTLTEKDSWISSSAHFKILADYCFYITKVDPASVVTLLVTNEFAEDTQTSLYARYPCLMDNKRFLMGLELHHPGIDFNRVGIHLLPCNLNEESGYFSESFKTISRFNPDIIIWFSGLHESLIFPRVLNKHFPNIFRQFGIAQRPRCAYNLGLTYSDSPPYTNPVMKWEKIQATFSDLPQAGEMEPELESILKKGFNIITVGGDINLRMDDKFIDGMCAILKKHPHVRWVLVGMINPDKFASRNKLIHDLLVGERIICLGTVDYLGKLLDCASIFVYPRHSGGAGGMALASIRGIPVITFTGGDAQVLYDTSDLLNNHEQLFKTLSILIDDGKIRMALGLKYKESFNGDQYLLKTREFIDTCTRVITDFNNNHLNSADLVG